MVLVWRHNIYCADLCLEKKNGKFHQLLTELNGTFLYGKAHHGGGQNCPAPFPLGEFSKKTPELARTEILATLREKSEKRETALETLVPFNSWGAIGHRTWSSHPIPSSLIPQMAEYSFSCSPCRPAPSKQKQINSCYMKTPGMHGSPAPHCLSQLFPSLLHAAK